MAWSWVIYSFLYKKLVIVSTILGKKYILRQAVRKNNFPHMWWIFPWGKIIFHTLSLIKGSEEKKRKCVENGHSKLEMTRKIKKKMFFLTLHKTVTPYVAIVFTKLVIYVLKPVCIEFFAQEVWAVCCYAGIPIFKLAYFEQVFPLG